MIVRAPSSQPLSNSGARFAFIMRSGNTWSVCELGGRTFLAVACLVILLLTGSVAGALYQFFRDDLVQGLLSGESRDIRAYEERIAELRSRIDRMTTRQIANQDTIEDRVAVIVARQAELEARYLLVSDLEQRATHAGVPAARGREASPTPVAPRPVPPRFEARFPLPPAIGGPAESSRTAPSAQPRPLDGQPANSFAPNSFAPLEPQLPANSPKGFENVPFRGAIKDVVSQIDRRTQRMEDAQIDAMHDLAQAALEAADRQRKILAATGLPVERFGKTIGAALAEPVQLTDAGPMLLRDVSASHDSAIGGPFLPASENYAASRFEDMFSKTDRAIGQAGIIKQITRQLPLGRPLGTDHDITSNFGTRVDPFTRGLAMHSGIDFRAPTGTPVRATAPGKVIEAGVNGGYGRMVDIDHGNGILTRYAHLSAISVNEGERIESGQIIGMVGSSGRSTGPHLHYEVRIDEDATDPLRFLRASKLASAQR
ncbi:NlpD Membrane proteins related to metalloendopeptidases [Rhabdaerophilaceae bacterium]